MQQTGNTWYFHVDVWMLQRQWHTRPATHGVKEYGCAPWSMSSALREEVGKKKPSPFFKVMAKHYRMSEALGKGAASTNRDRSSLEKSQKLLSIVWVESSWMSE